MLAAVLLYRALTVLPTLATGLVALVSLRAHQASATYEEPTCGDLAEINARLSAIEEQIPGT